jgi:thymidylate synthase (FAD)
MPIPPMGIEEFHDDLREVYEHSRRVYTKWIERGMAKELARLPAPVAQYSRMRASANLRNWLAFLSLRSTAKGPSAQWEIRQFADAVHAELREAFPRTLALFDGGAP